MAGALAAVLAIFIVGVIGFEWRRPDIGATGPFVLLATFALVATVPEELLVWRRGVLAPVAAHLLWNASFLALAAN